MITQGLYCALHVAWRVVPSKLTECVNIFWQEIIIMYM